MNTNPDENATEEQQPAIPQTTEQQEKSDPQLTELRGFFSSKEDIEPTLTDGTKAPDKALEEYKQNEGSE